MHPGVRGRHRAGAFVLTAALALAACGGDDTGDDTGDDDTEAAALAADTDDDQDDEEAAAPPAETLESADGWNGPAEVDGPSEPGAAVLSIEGQDIDLILECELSQPSESYILFQFTASGVGETDDGRSVRATASRSIHSEEEAAKSVYDYKGQERGSFQVTVDADEGMFHSSVVVSPADDDTTGSNLPITRVSEDGSFGAAHDLDAMSMHETALTGPAEFAGQCQDGWSSPA